MVTPCGTRLLLDPMWTDHQRGALDSPEGNHSDMFESLDVKIQL